MIIVVMYVEKGTYVSKTLRWMESQFCVEEPRSLCVQSLSCQCNVCICMICIPMKYMQGGREYVVSILK